MKKKQTKDKSDDAPVGTPSSRHTTPRTPLQVPETWKAVLEQLARDARQPMSWYLQSLIAEAADKAGITRPKLRWEEDRDG